MYMGISIVLTLIPKINKVHWHLSITKGGKCRRMKVANEEQQKNIAACLIKRKLSCREKSGKNNESDRKPLEI
jgi:hypothetical protein